jgi:hyperosmotically inducible periplasmic protein
MSAKTMSLLAALAAATLVSVGCQQRSGDTLGRNMGQPPERMQAATGQAAEQVATAAEDAAITAKVKAAMLTEPGLRSLQISVDTKAATVTLSGSVQSDIQRDRAKQIAMSTEGVKNVVDNLSIKVS